jgi:hypothetical protein
VDDQGTQPHFDRVGPHPEDHRPSSGMGFPDPGDHFPKILGRQDAGQGVEEFLERRPGKDGPAEVVHPDQTPAGGKRVGFDAFEAQGLEAFFSSKAHKLIHRRARGERREKLVKNKKGSSPI